jgi:hypothetical protein
MSLGLPATPSCVWHVQNSTLQDSDWSCIKRIVNMVNQISIKMAEGST